MENKLNNNEKFRLIEKIKLYSLYIIAICSLILILASRINEFYDICFLIGRILLGIFFIIFGVLFLYSGVFLRKIRLTGRFLVSDTYHNRAAIIQGILAFICSITIALIFIIGNTTIAICLIPILVMMIVSHFIFPPKDSSPNIKFFNKK